MGLIKSIRRYFRSRGFGVHSPLAYRIVTESLMLDRNRYRYYSDRYIESVSKGDRLTEKTAMFALRLVALLLPHCIWIPGKQAEIIRDCLRKTYHDREISGADKCPENADLIVLFRDDTRLRSMLTVAPEPNCALLVVPPPADEGGAAIRGLHPTLILRSRWFTLFCRRKGMDFVEYDI